MTAAAVSFNVHPFAPPPAWCVLRSQGDVEHVYALLLALDRAGRLHGDPATAVAQFIALAVRGLNDDGDVVAVRRFATSADATLATPSGGAYLIPLGDRSVRRFIVRNGGVVEMSREEVDGEHDSIARRIRERADLYVALVARRPTSNESHSDRKTGLRRSQCQLITVK